MVRGVEGGEGVGEHKGEFSRALFPIFPLFLVSLVTLVLSLAPDFVPLDALLHYPYGEASYVNANAPHSSLLA